MVALPYSLESTIRLVLILLLEVETEAEAGATLDFDGGFRSEPELSLLASM